MHESAGEWRQKAHMSMHAKEHKLKIFALQI